MAVKYLTMEQYKSMSAEDKKVFDTYGIEIVIKQEKAAVVKDTPFTKQDGTVVMMSAKEAAAKEAYRQRSANRQQAIDAAVAAFHWTPALDAIIKANPAISLRLLKEASKEAKGCSREQLAARKRELGVR